MTAKTEDIKLFAVVTAWPRLGTWSITTLRVESKRFLIYKLCLTRLSDRRTYVAAIVFFALIVRDGESTPKLKKYAKGPRESFFSATTKQ